MSVYSWKSIVEGCLETFENVTIEPATVSSASPDHDEAVEVVRSSLEDPVDSAPLSRRLSHCQSVTLVVPDATRSLGAEIVDAVLQHMERYLPNSATVSALVATGLHRRPTDDEMRECAHLAALTANGITVHAHNARAARPVPVEPSPIVNPATHQALPVWLNPLVTDVDMVITLSRVELHQYAGYSGGYKPIAIGCAGTRTIAEIHGLPILQLDGTRIGRLRGNPFQQSLTAVGRLAAPVFSVHETLGDAGKAYASGAPDEALRLLANRTDATFYVDTELFDGAVIHVTGPKAVNLYQASRAYTYLTLQDDPPIVPGGPVLLVAECLDGFGDGKGELAFREALDDGLYSLARELESGVADGHSGGRQRAYMVARASQRNPLHLFTRHDFAGQLPPGIAVHRGLQSALVGLREDAPTLDPEGAMDVLLTREVFRSLPRHRRTERRRTLSEAGTE